MVPMPTGQNEAKFLQEDFEASSSDESEGPGGENPGAAAETNDPNQLKLPKTKPKKMKPIAVDKQAMLYRFLLLVTEGLSSD